VFRPVTTLLTFLALAAWAGAQGPPPGPTAADRLKLLRANHMLIENLVDHGIGMADADTPLKRAAQSRRTAQMLANEVQAAADGQNAARVAELSGHLDAVLRDALAPNLDRAARDAAPGSPAESEVKSLRAAVLADVDGIRGAIPAGGKVGDDAGVRDARRKFESLRDKLK
jgi:hypothetical protein